MNSQDQNVYPVTVQLPVAMIEEIDKLAEEEGLMRGRSAIARRAITMYLSKAKGATGENTEPAE